MRYPIDCRPELCTATERGRYPMHVAKLVKNESGGGVLLATNGRTLLSLNVFGTEEDHDGYVTGEALKECRKKKRRGSCPDALLDVGEDSLGMNDGLSMPKPDESDLGDFPNVQAVMVREEDRPRRLYLDAELLYELAQGLGNNQLCIMLPDSDKPPRDPLRVEAYGSKKNGFGIIMPINPPD